MRGLGDKISSGWILCVEAPEGLPAEADARALAARGLWFDALAAASVAADNDDGRVRDALLARVGPAFAGAPKSFRFVKPLAESHE